MATRSCSPRWSSAATGGLQSREFDDLFNGNSSNNSSSYYLAGPAINWTVFDAGRRKAGVKFAEAQVDAAKAAYQDTVLRAFREVESSLVAVDRAREQVGDLQRLSASAGKARRSRGAITSGGILDQLTVLDAQRQSNRADMLLAQGEVSLVVERGHALQGAGRRLGSCRTPRPPHNPSRRSQAKETCHESINSQTHA